MPETLLLNLLCIPGLVVLSIGIWLFRSGKTIEQKIPVADTDSFLKPTPQMDRTSLLFYNFQAHFQVWFLELWKANSTKPLAYICIASGLVLILLSLVSIFNFPIVVTKEQFIWMVLFFVSILFLSYIRLIIFGIIRTPLIVGTVLALLLAAAYFIF